jgi:hypothetical protein
VELAPQQQFANTAQIRPNHAEKQGQAYWDYAGLYSPDL